MIFESRCNSQFASRLPLYSLPRTWNKFTKLISDYNNSRATYKRLFKTYIFNSYSTQVRCSNTHFVIVNQMPLFSYLLYGYFILSNYLTMFILCCYGHTQFVCLISVPRPATNEHQFLSLSLILHGSLSVRPLPVPVRSLYTYLFGARRKTANSLLFWSPNFHHHYIIFFLTALDVLFVIFYLYMYV